jgi:hypothetical protein
VIEKITEKAVLVIIKTVPGEELRKQLVGISKGRMGKDGGL